LEIFYVNSVKTVQYFLLLATLAVSSLRAEDEWRRVAFVGDAKVKSISGLVEVIAPETRVLREGEKARVGDVLRVWRGAEVVLRMDLSQSLVRAKGPVLLRLAPADGYDRASLSGADEKAGFVVRAVHGHGRFSEDGVRWHDLRTGMVLNDGARVRPFRDTIIDLYHNRTGEVLRLTDHTKAMALISKPMTTGSDTMVAAKAP
jgi:hypothetical protein